MLRLFPEAAIRFYVNDQYQVLFSPRDKDKTEVETTVLRVALGAFTALVTTTLVRAAAAELRKQTLDTEGTGRHWPTVMLAGSD